MPTVPRVAPDQVQTRPVAGARLTVQPSPAAYGSQLGATVAGVGAELLALAQARAVTTQTMRATREAMAEERQLLDDPETGALHVRGPAAMEVFDPTMAELQKRYGAITDRVKNRQARDAVVQLLERRWQQAAERLGDHGVAEVEADERREHEARLTATVDEAITYVGEGERFDQALARVGAAVKESTARYGLGPAAAAALLQEKQTAVHIGAIERHLAAGDDRAAAAHLERFRAQLAGGALAELERKVDVAQTDAAALEAEELAWLTFGPQTRWEPIAQDVIERKLREALDDQPKILARAIELSRTRRQSVLAARQEEEDANESAVWRAVAAGASFEQIRRMPEYQNARGQLQAAIGTRLRTDAERRADRAYTAGQRAQTAREAATEARQHARYWELREPARLATLSEDAIVARAGELGSTLTERLLDAKRQGGPGSVKDAVIDRAVFDQLLRRSGLTLDDAQRGDLLVAVENAIDLKQQSVGNRKVTRQEALAEAQAILDERVFLDLSFRRDPSRAVATIVNPQNRARAYVPTADIPDEDLAESLNYVRTLDPELLTWSDDEILRRFQRRIERAYARRLLGGSRAEGIAILRGREE